MSKRGRPRAAAERRDMIICVRLTLPEYRYVKALAMSQKNRPVSEVVRSLALAGMPAEEVKGAATCSVGTEGVTLASVIAATSTPVRT
jgi:hypothetical protein